MNASSTSLLGAQVQLMEEMVREQAEAVVAAGHAPPWLQKHATEWGQHPWGGAGVSADEDITRQLRDWTLAQVIFCPGDRLSDCFPSSLITPLTAGGPAPQSGCISPVATWYHSRICSIARHCWRPVTKPTELRGAMRRAP